MKTPADFDEETLERMRRCIACFAINMYNLPKYAKLALPHTALCSEAPLLKEDEADRLT